MDFRIRLAKTLANFNKTEALKLSDELHKYEESGGELTDAEDRLWEKLTYRIETSG
jgi:hypothetical protein